MILSLTVEKRCFISLTEAHIMTIEKPFYHHKNASFIKATPEADLLHPGRNKLIDHDGCAETQYFGFSVYEANIHAMNYLVHRPNLKVVTGGPWVWQGFKITAPFSEMFDIHCYMNDSALSDDLHHYEFDNGYSVSVLEPMKRHRIAYDDPERGNAFDVEYTAIAEAAMWADGNHFEQPMKAKGTLKLRGKDYKVDCYTVRDRSWGKPRPENHQFYPPGSWITGVFNDDFSFSCMIYDSVHNDPRLKGTKFGLPEDMILTGGCIFDNGELYAIIEGHKRYVERDPVTKLARKVGFDMIDERGKLHSIDGEIRAACPWNVWPNCYVPVSLSKWTYGKLTGFGDFQEFFSHDYINEFG